MAATRLRPDQEAGTGSSISATNRTGTAMGGRPFMADCAAKRPCASYLRVDAVVPRRVIRGRPLGTAGPAMMTVTGSAAIASPVRSGP